MLSALVDFLSFRPRAFAYASSAMALAAAVIAVPSSSNAAVGDAALFVRFDGSDASPCTRVAPCASLRRAYEVAGAGDVVEVAAGFYPPQQLIYDARKRGSKHVVFRPAAGATVVLNDLTLGTDVSAGAGPQNVTVMKMRVADASGKQRGIAAFNGTNNVVLEGMDAANFYLNGVKNFTVRGGDWGPCTTTSTDTQSNEASDGCSNSKIDGNPNNENIVIEGAVFHDYRIIPGSGAHFECMFVVNGTNITIRRNRFVNCEFYDIFFQNFAQNGPVTGIVIENNWFDTPWNGANVQNRPGAIEFSPRGRPFTNVLVRRNSFVGTGIGINGDGDGTPYTNFVVAANILRSYGCYGSATFRSNIFVGATCGRSDRGRVFGYTVENGRLVPVAAEAAAVRRAFTDVAKGDSLVRIARRLVRSRLPAPNGRRWTAAAVRGVVVDEAYRGGGYGAVGAHPRIVTARVWRDAQRRLRR